MSRPPRYAAVIVDDGEELTITQYANARQARLDYQEAINEGYTAYFYAFPIRRKSDISNPAPIEITD
jgi:hypothetical protein